MRRRPSWGQLALLVLVALIAIAGASVLAQLIGPGRSPVATPSAPSATGTPVSGLPTVAVADLPAAARATLDLVDRGGPFPYAQDGTVFLNAEGLLPPRARGYYHEYTVATPGSSDRGTRRLVRGAGGDLYYTADHYGSFRQVVR